MSSATSSLLALDQAGLPIVLGGLAVLFIVAWVLVIVIVGVGFAIAHAVRRDRRKKQAQEPPPGSPPS